MEVFSLFGSVTVDDEDVKKSLEEIDNTAEQTEVSVGKSLGGMAKSFVKFTAIAGAAVAGLVAGLFALTNRVTSAGDEIDKASARAGVGAEAFQELRFAAEQNGMSQQSLERSLQNVNRQLGRGEEASDGFKRTMEELGITASSTEDVFEQTVDRLREIDDSQRQAALAAEIFGERASRQLLPALREGESSFAELREEAREAGIVMGEDNVKASAQFQDALNKARQILGVFVREIVMRVLPAFQAMLDWISNNAGRITALFEFIANVTAIVFRTIAGIIGDVLSYLGEAVISPFGEWFAGFWADNGEFIGEITKTTMNVLRSIFETTLELMMISIGRWVTNVQQVIELFFNVFQGNWSDAWQNIINIFENIWGGLIELVEGPLKPVADFVANITSEVIKSFVNMRNRVRESVSNMVTDIQEWLGKRLEKVTAPALNTIDAINEKFAWLRDRVTGNSHIPDMVEDIDKEWNKLRDNWNNNGALVLDDIDSDFENLRDGMDEYGEDIADNISDSAEEAKSTLQTLIDSFLSASPILSNVIDSAMAGMAQGGPIMAIGNIFATLMAESEQFEAIMNMVNQGMEFLANVVGAVLEPLITVLEVLTPLLSALGQLFATLMQVLCPVISIISKVLGPTFSILAKVIATVANFFIRIMNAVISALNRIPFVSISKISTVDTSAPSVETNVDDIDTTAGEKSGRGGTQISEITGPTRDLLTDLLAPLANFNSLVGIGNRIYDLLDARLPNMNQLAIAGGGSSINIEQILVDATGGDATEISTNLVDELEEALADRLIDNRRGGGR